MKPVLPISVRTFLLVFLPMSLALIAGFVHLQRGTEVGVRAGLRQTLAEAQKANLNEWQAVRARDRKMLGAATENSAFKTGLALWRSAGRTPELRRTVEDQLADLGSSLGYDLLALRDASERPVAGVRLALGKAESLDAERIAGLRDGLSQVDGLLYETLLVPINNDVENLGMLVVGQRFQLRAAFGIAALMSGANVVESAVPGVHPVELERALGACGAVQAECEVKLNGESYLVLRTGRQHFGGGFTAYTFHSVDAASAGIVNTARKSFRVSLLATLLAAMLVGVWATRSLIRPLTQFVDRLQESEQQGLLHSDFPTDSTTEEINQLARAFNKAAQSIAESQRKLDEAYIEFTRTMAQTLDARDPYTAGHSSRVSAYAVAIAGALNLSAQETEVIRIGANLHDIGKIGVPDEVLRKPGQLTAEEMETIKEHPVIGKRILEGVARFREYLDIVELHHENHDGSGYPWGMRSQNIPLGARIVHVVDAYDAMTTSRPYRKAMRTEEAAEVLRRHSGTMFDPEVVDIFLRIVKPESVVPVPDEASRALSKLSDELRHSSAHESMASRN